MKPPFIDKSDQICIISPSGAIAAEYIDGASKLLESWGYVCLQGKNAKNTFGRFAGTKEERITDLQTALDNPNIKAILCSRGGYGLSQIIDSIDFRGFIEHPKWLIGFSDITILHNAITNLGFASMHGLMAKQLTELPEKSEEIELWRKILRGDLPRYKTKMHPLNREGKATGKLIGGNLSVLAALRGSSYDLNYKKNILFIEDIGEEPYHIDRMIQNLRLGNVLEQISGLVVGQFSDCNEDPLMKQNILESIYDAVKEYDFPLGFNFPAGHIDNNHPLILGANVNLNVTNECMYLNWQ
jgi:muramoyltetrapeptide carboxypeptidase